MALSDKMMLRFSELDSKIQRREELSAKEKTEFEFILQAYLRDMRANDPAEFARQYGHYKVSAEQFEEITGEKPEEEKKQ